MIENNKKSNNLTYDKVAHISEKQFNKRSDKENSFFKGQQVDIITKNMEWHEESAYAYFWVTAPGVGIKEIEKLYLKYGSYQNMYQGMQENTLYYKIGQSDEDSDFKREKKRKLEQHFKDWKVHDKYQELIKNRIFCIPRFLHGYPSKLTMIDRPPAALFVKGKLPDEGCPLVAVIGARNCSNYGIHMAMELGRKLAENGIGLVSGLARGIDGTGQWAALNEGGATFGILGSGVDVCYPPENIKLYERLAAGEGKGGIISEMPPGIQPERNFFPMRNRIISGLADAVIVIEAKEKSGTFITIQQALEQGKDVYACPGRLGDPLSIGCNKLISQGAGILWNMDEFVKEVYHNASFQVHVNCNLKKFPNKAGNIAQHEAIQTMQDETEKMKSNEVQGELPDASWKQKLTSFQKQIYEVMDYNMQPVDHIWNAISETRAILLKDVLIELSRMEQMGILVEKNGYYGIAP